MSFRSYVKVARPAEHNSTFTKQRNVTGAEGGGGPGVPGPEGPQGPPGEDGKDGKDGVVDPSKLNMVFNTDQIELVDSEGNFCGLHVKGINGITVTEDETYGNQTMVISGNSTSLENRIADGEEVQGQILTAVQLGVLKQQQIQNQIDELSVTKGKVARYTTTEINSVPNVSRPGQLAVNNADPAEVTLVSFGTEDLDNILTKPMANGDIIEFVDSIEGNINRFIILDAAGAPTLVAVEHVSGDNSFAVDEEEQVYIYPQNASGASKDYVDAQDTALQEYVDEQDALKLNLTGGKLTGALSSKSGGATLSAYKIVNQNDDQVALKMWCPGGAGTQMKYVGNNNTDHWFQLYDEEDKNPVTTAKFAYANYHLQAAPGVGYGGSDKHYFTGQAVFFDRITYDGPTENDTDVATKAYVDSVSGSGVPTGTVAMWFGTTAPTGWLICDGSSFSTTTYAALHTHLQTVPNYTSGETPNFQGLYPGGAGSGHGNTLTSAGESKANIYHSQRTASPNGGNPTSIAEIPDGTTRTFNGTGGTNAYSAGLSRVNISEGWDAVTRHPTLSVHFIIKAV